MHGLNIKSHVPQNKKEMNEWINKSIKQIKSLHQLFILENKLKKNKQSHCIKLILTLQ